MKAIPDWIDAIPVEDLPTDGSWSAMSDEEIIRSIQSGAMELRRRAEWLDLRDAFSDTLRERLGESSPYLVIFADLVDRLGQLPIQPDVEEWADLHDAIPSPKDGRRPWLDWFTRLEGMLTTVVGVETTEPAFEFQPAPPPPVFAPVPGPRADRASQAEKRMKDVLVALAIPQMSPSIRLGIDFGTSQSKIIARESVGEQVRADLMDVGESFPSAIAFGLKDGSVHFGEKALAAYTRDPRSYNLQKSLKRMLLAGKARGIAEVGPTMTTSLAAALGFTWLYGQAFQAAVDGNTGALWLDTHLTTPVTGPESQIPPFWRNPPCSEVTSYPDYLRYLAVAGAAVFSAFEGELPSCWREFVQPFQRIALLPEKLMNDALRACRVASTIEPMAALLEHTAAELGNGWHLVVDSGAGTTDWAVILIHGGQRHVLSKGCLSFGGDDIDALMMAKVRAEIGPEVGRGFDTRILMAMADLKPELFSTGFVDFNPAISLPDAAGTLPVQIESKEILALLQPQLRALTDGIRRSIAEADLRTPEARERLKRDGIPVYREKDLQGVWLVGGTTAVPAIVDAVKASVPGAKVDLLRLPVSEDVAARKDAARFRISAVAMGASRSTLPPSELLPQDTSMEGGLVHTDKDAG